MLRAHNQNSHLELTFRAHRVLPSCHGTDNKVHSTPTSHACKAEHTNNSHGYQPVEFEMTLDPKPVFMVVVMATEPRWESTTDR